MGDRRTLEAVIHSATFAEVANRPMVDVDAPRQRSSGDVIDDYNMAMNVQSCLRYKAC